MKILIALDLFFLIMLEKFSHRFQKLTGIDCFTLSKICCVVWFMDLAFMNSWTNFNSIILNIFIIFLFMFEISNINRIESEWRKNSQFVNKAIYTLFPSRMIRWLICILLSGNAIIEMFFILSIYFVSCTPLPENKSKIKQWIDGLIEGLKEKQTVSVTT